MAVATSISGVAMHAGVVLTAGLQAYARVLRGSLDATVPLTITSGVRTVAEQASAMLGKLKAGGEEEILAVYGSNPVTKKLLAAPRDAASWAKVIQADGANLSRHMRGGSFDLHTRTLSPTQVGKIQAAVLATGGRYQQEGAPPHMHVDVPSKYALASGVEVAAGAGETGAKLAGKSWLVVTAAGLAILGALAWRDRKKMILIPTEVPRGQP